MTNKIEAIVATHNKRTIESYRMAMDLKQDQVLGLNPELIYREPESDLPVEPALIKLIAVEELAREMGLTEVVIVASDVIYRMNGKVRHRAPEFRDTTNKGRGFSPRAVEYLFDLYAKESFMPSWLTSFGVSRVVRNSENNRTRSVTEPVEILGHYPALSPAIVLQYLEPHATPGIDLIDLARDKNIKLAMKTMSSDKVRDITPAQAKRMVVDRAPKDKATLASFLRQPRTTELHHSEELNLSVSFQQLLMSEILDQMVAA